MANLFENPVILKLQAMSQRAAANKFVSSLTTGMLSMLGPIMVAAVCQVICALGTMFGLFTAESAVYGYIYGPYHFIMDLLGLWVTTLIGYNYAKALDMKLPLATAIDTAIVFVLTCATFADGTLSTTYLSSTGMFVGFVVAFAVVRIEKLCFDKNLRIPMPDVCPPSLVNSFSVIIPLGINVIIFQGLNAAISVVSAGALTFPSALMALIIMPLSALTSLPGIFLLCFISLVMWCFGIHGGITYPVIMASLMDAVSTNAALVASGQDPVFAPVLLYGAMAAIGGTGCTFPLVLLSLRAKSEQLRAVSKVAVVPACFSITEPVIFGMPIMYNPILCIPFVLNTMVVMLLFYLGYMFGIITPPYIMIMAVLPIGLGDYMGSMNITNAIYTYLLIIPSMLIWYPFFKVYDNQLYASEQEKKRQTEASAAELA